MKNPLPSFCFALGILTLPVFAADDLPTSQPNVISIIREQVKVGHVAAHGRHEAGWPAAFEKAKHPYHYIALTSITGPDEAWYVIPYESHAKMGDDFQKAEGDRELSAETERLSAEDAQHVSSASVIHAAGRKDLSYGDFPEIAQMRLFVIETFTVRPGHGTEFEEAAKAYAAAAKKAGVKTGFRTYQVLAGMPAPTYLVFSSLKEFGEWNKGGEEFGKTMAAANEQEKAAMQKGMREAVVKQENTRFRIDPKQSYVPLETRKKAPDFWLAK
jgi:heme-degrading monooxygenase HmoA